MAAEEYARAGSDASSGRRPCGDAAADIVVFDYTGAGRSLAVAARLIGLLYGVTAIGPRAMIGGYPCTSWALGDEDEGLRAAKRLFAFRSCTSSC